MSRIKAGWAVTAIVVAGMVVASCGSGSDGAGSTPSSAPTTGMTTAPPTGSTPTESEATATPVQPSTPAAKPKDAATIAKAMGLGKVHVWTEETDPNKLLGRPSSYTSAATVIDSRISCDDPKEPGTDCGARVEVFGTAAQAKKRSDYIQGILDGGGALGTEYHTLSGAVLLRVTGELTPKQAAVYAAKFTRVSG
jgi:hypothetical protein